MVLYERLMWMGASVLEVNSRVKLYLFFVIIINITTVLIVFGILL